MTWNKFYLYTIEVISITSKLFLLLLRDCRRKKLLCWLLDSHLNKQRSSTMHKLLAATRFNASFSLLLMAHEIVCSIRSFETEDNS